MKPQPVVDAFGRRFGVAPTLVAVAPGRINLIGEHTDYNDGFVLPASIDRGARCALRQNDSHQYRLLAVDFDAYTEVHVRELVPQRSQWPNYLLGVVDELRKLGHGVSGFDVALTCDVPRGAGLSSSAAIESAFVTGLDALFGFGLDEWTKVRVGQAAENGFVGADTGMLDQFASIFGEADTALLLDCRSLEVRRTPIELPGHTLVVLNTGVKHNHVTSGYAARRADCERAVRLLRAAGWAGESLRDLDEATLLRYGGATDGEAAVLDERAALRARFVVAENARVLAAAAQLERGDVTGFGESLLAGHWGLSELYQVSCPESDAVVRFAEAHPAVKGARQMGGGFGGCVLCVVEAGAEDDFVDVAQQEYFDRFAIALEPLNVALGPGARVLDREVQT